MSEVTITIEEDGPYVVDGDIRITDDDGSEVDPQESAALANDRIASDGVANEDRV